MKFMMMAKANADYEAGKPPKPEMMAAMGKFVEESLKSGALITTGGLLPSSHGWRLRAGNGKLTVIDGPFAETKELIGGYAIVEAKSREEAMVFARKFMQIHLDVLGSSYDGECEIRPIFDPADCTGKQ